MTDAMFTHTLHQSRFPQVHSPIAHTVLTRIMDDTNVIAAPIGGVNVTPSLTAQCDISVASEVSILTHVVILWQKRTENGTELASVP